jgi:hypothetical protein
MSIFLKEFSSSSFPSNFQNLILIQLAKFIYGKWLIWLTIANIFEFYELILKIISIFS